MLNTTHQLSPQEWNEILLRGRSPVIVGTASLFVLGFMGNLMVILVYRLKMQKHNQEVRFYIPFLATADMIAITITSIFMMICDINEAIFPSDTVCRIFQFLNWSGVQNSTILLLVVAVHRYKIVCCPTRRTLPITKKKVLVGITAACALTMSLPLLVFSGTFFVTVRFKGTIATGYFCSFHTGKHLVAETVYEYTLFIINIVLLISTSAVYVPIGRIVFEKSRNALKNPKLQNAKEIEDVKFSSSTQRGLDDISNEQLSSSTRDAFDCKSTEMSNTICAENSDEEHGVHKITKQKRGRTQKNRGLKKFTITLIMVMVFAIISFTPFYVIVALRLNDLEAWFNSPPSRINALLLVYRSYMFNSIANPIVYSIFDTVFRKKLIEMLRKLCNRLASILNIWY